MSNPLAVSIGEPAPWFSAEIDADSRSGVAFDELAGRYIALFFFGAAARPGVAEILAEVARRPDMFDGKNAMFVGVGDQRDDFAQDRLPQREAGQLYLWDSEGVAAQRYGIPASTRSDAITTRPIAFLLSPALQIIDIIEVDDPATFVARLDEALAGVVRDSDRSERAPALIVPRVFDRDFCRRLIDLHNAAGGREIGAVEYGGKIVERFDPQFRKRFDYYISDEHALNRSRELISRRLLPLVYRAFQFRVTRIERYLVGCYDSTTGGYFRPHRDNTTPLSAHRRFALTINLNEDYDGGDLAFPEYDRMPFRADPGDAIVFSCSLLHEVTPVSRNRRYAFISFLYDEPSQRIREENQRAMAGNSSSSNR